MSCLKNPCLIQICADLLRDSIVRQGFFDSAQTAPSTLK